MSCAQLFMQKPESTGLAYYVLFANLRFRVCQKFCLCSHGFFC